jgi:Fur family ferric uptake transcriptional regulator
MAVNFDQLKETLKTKGYKLTPQRRAILDVVIESQGEHLSTEEIYDIVRNGCPDIGLATVYRTLQLLSDMSILSKLNLDDGLTRYELNVDEDSHHHHHLICTECGKVSEVVDDLLEPLEVQIENDYGFKVQDHKLKFFGICKDCQ